MDAGMNADFLQHIDWSRPWLTHVRTIGETIAQSPDWRAALNQQALTLGLRNHRGLPIQFVPQADLPYGVAYEAFISNAGQVPTRDNLHDFFNSLVWLTFPCIKAQLNALQAREIEQSAVVNGSATRGKLRDAATIFDENAALLITANTELVTGLRAHAWAEVFLAQRASFRRECSVFLFGHALMEKLVAPYKSITGHMWVVAADRLSFASMTLQDQCRLIDAQVADQLRSGLATSDFSPLPILGVPDWWVEQDEKFYRDAAVFRPRRKA
jgi:hypothetical protein